MSDDSSYEVGYKKPPVHTRFRPGRSGNPKGRAPKTLNLKTDLLAELTERIGIREGDRFYKVSKQRAVLKALVAKALKGDAKAANTVLVFVAKMFVAQQAPDDALGAISPEELRVFDEFIARQIGKGDGNVK